MVTTFYLEPGYAYSKENLLSVSKLHEIAKHIPLPRLREKVVELGVKAFVTDDVLEDYLYRYNKMPTMDATCRFTEKGIMQSASGVGKERKIKEYFRRAFCLVILEECFTQEYNVTLSIV